MFIMYLLSLKGRHTGFVIKSPKTRRFWGTYCFCTVSYYFIFLSLSWTCTDILSNMKCSILMKLHTLINRHPKWCTQVLIFSKWPPFQNGCRFSWLSFRTIYLILIMWSISIFRQWLSITKAIAFTLKKSKWPLF